MSLTKENKAVLLEVAKSSIRHGLTTGRALTVQAEGYPAEVIERRATFVTLNCHRRLRGCIGTLQADSPLIVDVAENAFAAAFEDPRFPPLDASELSGLEIHISILTPSEPMLFQSEEELISQLKPGVDGLILEEGSRRGTFLPMVWRTLSHPREFLRRLKQKAGLAEDYWSDQIRIFRYSTEEFSNES
ncbi:MAG: AmmeMemoRadiSam system protein A [Gammaproteobacteria bacterium]